MRAALWLAVLFFPVSELILAAARHSRGTTARAIDRGSLWINWAGITAGVGLAIASEWVRSARMALPVHLVVWLALACIVVGLAVRWTAIITLGRLFTVDVAIHDEHPVVQHGLYRFVRHPSYSGMMLAFVGVGLAFYNWLSLVALLVPVSLVVANRIRHEERTLLDTLGAPYAEYCARTKRLVPGVF
jgi:protein-S-isoprenylcysteine O-methyltransferase Ste14